jgi:hypothetical protein
MFKQTIWAYVGFEGFMAVNVKNGVFWDVMPFFIWAYSETEGLMHKFNINRSTR